VVREIGISIEPNKSSLSIVLGTAGCAIPPEFLEKVFKGNFNRISRHSGSICRTYHSHHDETEGDVKVEVSTAHWTVGRRESGSGKQHVVAGWRRKKGCLSYESAGRMRLRMRGNGEGGGEEVGEGMGGWMSGRFSCAELYLDPHTKKWWVHLQFS